MSGSFEDSMEQHEQQMNVIENRIDEILALGGVDMNSEGDIV